MSQQHTLKQTNTINHIYSQDEREREEGDQLQAVGLVNILIIIN